MLLKSHLAWISGLNVIEKDVSQNFESGAHSSRSSVHPLVLPQASLQMVYAHLPGLLVKNNDEDSWAPPTDLLSYSLSFLAIPDCCSYVVS